MPLTEEELNQHASEVIEKLVAGEKDRADQLVRSKREGLNDSDYNLVVYVVTRSAAATWQIPPYVRAALLQRASRWSKWKRSPDGTDT